MKMQPIVNQQTVETDRFDLRPLRRSDQELIELYTSDARVAQNTANIPHPLPDGVIEAFIIRAMARERDEDVWVMDCTKSNGAKVAGVISDLSGSQPV